MATLPFSTGLHSVLSLSETGPTRTVAFPCLPGQLQHPLHQGWLLETFFSQQYIHLMWSRPAPCSLTHRGKLFMSAGETVQKHQSPRQWGFCCTNQLITTYAHHSVTYGYTYTMLSMKCYQLLPNNERGLLVFTQHLKFFYYLYRNYFIGEGKNLNLWPRQWHQNRFKLLSICLQSQCNAIITCFHGPRSHLACITKEKIFFTQGAFFLSSLCFTLVFGSYFWNRLEQQIKIWGMRQKTKNKTYKEQ